MSSGWHLVVSAWPEEGTRYAVGPAGLAIGRQPGNDLVLGDPQVSRRHARLDWQEGRLVATDLGSTGGTYVNGERVAGLRELRPGDLLRVGGTELRVEGPAAPPLDALVDAMPVSGGDAPAHQMAELAPPPPAVASPNLPALPHARPRRASKMRRVLLAIGGSVLLLACLCVGGPFTYGFVSELASTGSTELPTEEPAAAFPTVPPTAVAQPATPVTPAALPTPIAGRPGALPGEFRPRQTIAGHKGGVWSVAFSPDGKLLASAGKDGAVKLWDPATGREVRTLKGFFGHRGWVFSVAFSPDGQTVASGGKDKTVKLWDPNTGKRRRTISDTKGEVFEVAFASNGTVAAAIGSEQPIRRWSITSGLQFPPTFWRPVKAVHALAYSPDGRFMAAGGEYLAVQVWETEGRQELFTLSRHGNTVRAVAFSPDSRLLASGSRDDTVKLWDLTTSTELQTLRGHTDDVWSVAFSPDGALVASASLDDTVKVWEVATGREIATLRGHTHNVFSVAFSPDGRTLATASDDRTIRLWDVVAAGTDTGGAATALAPDRLSPPGAGVAGPLRRTGRPAAPRAAIRRGRDDGEPL